MLQKNIGAVLLSQEKNKLPKYFIDTLTGIQDTHKRSQERILFKPVLDTHFTEYQCKIELNGTLPMIKFDSVFLTHQGKDIFSGFNMTIQKNEKILIQGKSGIGKTTFFRILLGFEQIDKGRVRFGGNRIDKAHIRGIRSQTFYLSQDIDLKAEKVGLLLDEILISNTQKSLKDYQSGDNSRLSELLFFLDLHDNILDQNVKDLSGGERQRVGLLICFLLDRPVWLLDEPTSALDDTMKKKIADYIIHQDKTIIIISHDDVWKKTPGLTLKRWQ